MNKFWEWMEKKGYKSLYGDKSSNIIENEYGQKVIPTKQMLIGYMIEYVSKHKHWKEYKSLPVMQIDVFLGSRNKSLYSDLTKVIKYINK